MTLEIRKPEDLWSDEAIAFLKAWEKEPLFKLLRKRAVKT